MSKVTLIKKKSSSDDEEDQESVVIVDFESASTDLKEAIDGSEDDKTKAKYESILSYLNIEGLNPSQNVSYNNAFLYAQRAYDHDSDDVVNIHNLALIYFNMRDYKKAEPLFIKCVKTQKSISDYDKATCASKLGEIYLEGRLDRIDYFRAYEYYNIANKAEPENQVYSHNLAYASSQIGMVYQNEGNHKKAYNYHKLALDFSPDNIGYNNRLADFYFVTQQYAKAKTLYKDCLIKADEDQTKAYCAHLLGNVFLQSSPKQTKQALDYLKISHELDPQNMEYTHNLAMTYLNTNNKKAAHVLFKQCAASTDFTEHFTSAVKDNCIQGISLTDSSGDWW